METRTCSNYGPQPLGNFSFKNKAKNVLQNLCKLCSSEYKKKWHIDNKSSHNAQIHANNKAALNIIKQNVCDYLSCHPCIDCGETDIIVLEFDHVDPSTKIMSVTTYMRRCYSWGKILMEIEKCVVRCANCHRRKTAKQFNFYRYGRGTEIQTQINDLEDRSPILLNDTSV